MIPETEKEFFDRMFVKIVNSGKWTKGFGFYEKLVATEKTYMLFKHLIKEMSEHEKQKGE